MQRQTVYDGQEVLETDLLNAQRGAYIALGKLAESLFSSATCIHHMPCVPGSGLTVSVGPGELYMTQADDATAWSSLEADSTLMQKQGLLLSAATLSTPAPTVSGQSIAYLIEGQVQQIDGGQTLLPYYNSADPTSPVMGPGGNGETNNTERNDVLALQVKAGTAATTGDQAAPTADTGWVPLWTVAVAYGQSSISLSNIAVASGAPFVPLTVGTLGTVLTVGTSLSIAATNVGQVLNCTAAMALSLPSAATVPNGFGFGFVASGGAVTLVPNGSDTIDGSNANWTLPQGGDAYVTRSDQGEWVITSTSGAASSAYTGAGYALIGSVTLPGESSVNFAGIPPTYTDLQLVFWGASSSANSDALSLGHSTDNGSTYASAVMFDVGQNPSDFVIDVEGYTQIAGGAESAGANIASYTATGGTGGVSSNRLDVSAAEEGQTPAAGDEIWYSGMATPAYLLALSGYEGGGGDGNYLTSPGFYPVTLEPAPTLIDHPNVTGGTGGVQSNQLVVTATTDGYAIAAGDAVLAPDSMTAIATVVSGPSEGGEGTYTLSRDVTLATGSSLYFAHANVTGGTGGGLSYDLEVTAVASDYTLEQGDIVLYVSPGSVITTIRIQPPDGGAGTYTLDALWYVPPGSPLYAFHPNITAGRPTTGAIPASAMTVTAITGGYTIETGDIVIPSSVFAGNVCNVVGQLLGSGVGTYTVSEDMDVPADSTVYGRHPNMVAASVANVARLDQKHNAPVNALEVSLASGTFETGTLYLYGK